MKTRELRALGYASLLLSLAALAPAAQAQVPAGAERRVNVNEAHKSIRPAVAQLIDGGHVVVWENDQLGVFARLFRADGQARGGEISVAPNLVLPRVPASGPVVYNHEPTVVAHPEGGFFVFWAEERATLSVTAFHENRDITARTIVGQRFNAQGGVVGGRLLASPLSNAQDGRPAVAAHRRLGLVVSWERDDLQDGGAPAEGIFVRRFSLNGDPLGEASRVNADDGAVARRPAVAVNSQGRFLVSWEACCTDGDSTGVFARLYRPSGSAFGPAFQVNESTTGAQRRPAVAASGQGFVIAWQGRFERFGDARIFTRAYAANGGARTAETQVSSGEHGGNAQIAPAIVALSSGKYVVAWIDYNEVFPIGLFSRELANDGAPAGAEVRSSENQVGSQHYCSLASTGGAALAAYEGFLDDELGVFVRKLGAASGASLGLQRR
jgi:large repetitive protein